MKKTVTVALALFFLLGIVVSNALAYDYPDNTLVQEWNKGGPYGSGTWKDVIGDSAIFNTFGANFAGNTLTIFTNWNPNTLDPSFPGVKTADLFIDAGCNGTWDYAIVLDNQRSDFGTAYEDPLTITTANDIFASQTGLVYGGQYDMANPKLTPVLATSSGKSDQVGVTWTIGTPNSVAIDLSSLGLTQPFGFYWATGTCSNDGFASCVPIPPSVLLMGSGLLGLGLLGWRRRSEDQVI